MASTSSEASSTTITRRACSMDASRRRKCAGRPRTGTTTVIFLTQGAGGRARVRPCRGR
jgi:hypothetical protein